jgi:hypothetical protein
MQVSPRRLKAGNGSGQHDEFDWKAHGETNAGQL